MTALGARRAATEPATLADVLTDALARPNVSPMIRDGVLVVAGAALTALAAQVSFTAPWTNVPYTLQTGSVLLVGTALGPRRAALSMAIYLLAGAVGLPVYSQGASGLAKLFGYTGGYLFGFVLAGARALANRAHRRSCRVFTASGLARSAPLAPWTYYPRDQSSGVEAAEPPGRSV